ncbi:MAG: DNA polymerase I [Candidatus Omnitrophica bacterium]|nr:DNA polymerase I [Candidatus Omnitrophota bacterium]
MPEYSRKKAFFIDGNSFCYRAFYAIRHLSNSKGQPTNAIYGFVTMIKKIISKEKPDFLAVAFDLKAPTFRHKKYEKYKITRKPMPDELISQMPYIKSVLKAYNIPIYELAGYEADDILATLAKKSEENGLETFIATSDKDALQLITPHVKVYNPQKEGAICGENEVKARFGFGPERITDFMALMGDTSDNIPGVPGIGEKTAIELMRKFKSLDELLKNSKNIENESRRRKIEESVELALLSKELVTLKKDVPLEIKMEDLCLKAANEKELLALFRELELRSFIKDVASKKDPCGKYYLADTAAAFNKLAGELEKAKAFAFDFETTHYDPMIASAVGVSFAWKENEAHYVPFNALSGIGREDVLRRLKSVFEKSSIKKIGQNIKYDMLILRNLGIEVCGIGFDTMVAAYLLNPSKSNHNLNEISIEYLDRSITPIEELIGKGKHAITMNEVEVSKVRDYCCEDSCVTFKLRGILEKKLAEKDLDSLFYEVEVPLIDVLSDMEFSGIAIDEKYLETLSKEMEKDIAKLEKCIYTLAGEEFNVNSSKQLQVILFQKMKLPVIKKTKTGASTDEEVLRALSEKDKLPAEILKYRALAKLKSTYVDSLPGLVNPKTGRIHTSFNQTVTATGRLSSSNPNLQNIPIKTELGRKIRKAFIAPKKSRIILAADYSQIELRLLAHFSGDKVLIDAFKEERDVHAFTASLIYGVSEKEVTKEMRQAAKTVNFGIVYGMSPYGLSKDLGIDVREASKFIDAYFERYPSVKGYLESKVDQARRDGYVTTILGRRRYIPEIKSPNVAMRNFAERTAVNTPLQGSAADLVKLAMISIYKKIKGTEAKMILQVHDELVFEVEKKSLEKFAKIVKSDMEGVVKLEVPLEAHIEYGPNWLEMERLEI